MMFSLQKPIFLWISLVVINSIGFPQPPTQNTQHFYIKRDKGKFITEWRVEYSATDTMVFSDLNGELIPVKTPMQKRNHIFTKEVDSNFFKSNDIKTFILKRVNSSGSSYGMGYNFMIDSLFYEHDLQKYTLPATDLGRFNSIDIGDTLIIMFDGDRFDKNFIISIKDGLTDSKRFKKQFGFIKSQYNKVYYVANQRVKRIKIPGLTWNRNDGEPVYVEYRMRVSRSNTEKYINDWLNPQWYEKLWPFGKDKDNHEIIMQNASKGIALTYGKLSFNMDKHYRYDAIKNEGELILPPIRIEQKGNSIIRTGDQIELIVEEALPVEWIGYVDNDSHFDIRVTSGRIVFTKTKDNTLSKEHLFPELQFKITERRSFSIGLNVKVIPKSGNWQKNYTVALHSDGLEVGHLSLRNIASSPVYFDKIYPNPRIDFITLQEDIAPIIRKGDTIYLHVSNGGKFDVRKRPSLSSNIKMNLHDNNKIVLLIKNNLIPQEMLTIRNVWFERFSSIQQVHETNINIHVKGPNFSQTEKVVHNVFHPGEVDTRLYEEKLSPNYKFSETLFNLTEELHLGDTLSMIFRNGHIGEREMRKNPIFSNPDFIDLFKPISIEKDKIVFVLKKGIKDFTVPMILWPSSQGLAKHPSFLDYEIRADQNRFKEIKNEKTIFFKWCEDLNLFKGKNTIEDISDILSANISKSVQLKYGSLSFYIDRYKRFVGLRADSILYLPPMVLKFSGDNILDVGDQIEVAFKGEMPVMWIDSPLSDPYFDVRVTPEKVVFTKIKYIEHSFEYLFPELPFKITEDQSFGIDLNVKVIPKSGYWQKDYPVVLHPDGLDVGMPEFVINEFTGIVRGRGKNRAPSIHIKTSKKSILKKGDKLLFTLHGNSDASWNRLFIPKINLNDIRFISHLDDTTLVFNIVNNLKDSSSITIDNLYIDKIENNYNDINLEIKHDLLTKVAYHKKYMNYSSPYVEFEMGDNILYANDDNEDTVLIILQGRQPRTKSFHMDDRLSILIPKNSGAKWNQKKINNKYSFLKQFSSDNQMLHIGLKELQDNGDRLGLQIVSNGQEPVLFNFRYRFYNNSNNSGDVHGLLYYNEKQNLEEKLFSSLEFSLVDDLIVFGGTKKPNTLKLPKLMINQSEHSKIRIKDQIRVVLPSPNDKYIKTYFLQEQQIIINGISTEPKILPNEIGFMVQGNIPDIYEVSDLDFILRMKRIPSETINRNLMAIYSPGNSSSEYRFPIKQNIKIGVPKFITRVDTIYWPMNKLFCPPISLDDSESNIFGSDSIRLKLQSESDIIYKWDYDIFTEEQKFMFNISQTNPSILIIKPKYARKGKKINIESLPIKGPSEFNDIHKYRGDKLYLKVSYDGGQNYSDEPKQILIIIRPQKIEFTKKCYTNIKFEKQYLPKLIIEENEDFVTINKGDEIHLTFSEEDPARWSKKQNLLIKKADEPINSDLIFPIVKNNKRTLILRFNKEIGKESFVSIEKLLVGFINKNEITDSFSPKIFFKDNSSIILDKMFGIYPANLEISFNDQPRYNLRTFEDYGGSKKYIDLPVLSIMEAGNYPMLHFGDTLIFRFPRNIIINESQLSFSQLFWTEPPYISIRDGFFNLMCVMKDSTDNGYRVIQGLKADFPKTTVTSSNIDFAVINDYNVYSTLFENQWKSIPEKITIESGQPLYFFSDRKNFIKGTPPEKLPTITIMEPGRQKYLVAGDTITIRIKDTLNVRWDITRNSVETNPMNIFNTKVTYRDSVSAQLVLKDRIGMSVDIDGLYIKTNKNTDIYIQNADTASIEIYGGKKIEESTIRPQKFGYDFSKGSPKGGRLGVGEMEIDWPVKSLEITKKAASDKVSIEVPSVRIDSKNLLPEEIPKRLRIKLTTYGKRGNELENSGAPIDLTANKNDQNRQYFIWDRRNLGSENQIDKKEIKNFEAGELEAFPSSWLTLDIEQGSSPPYNFKHKITTIHNKLTEENKYIDLSLFLDINKHMIASTGNKNKIVLTDEHDCGGGEYEDIFQIDTVGYVPRIISVILEDETPEHELIFDGDFISEWKIIDNENNIYAEGEYIKNNQLDFTLTKNLKRGAQYNITGIVLKWRGKFRPPKDTGQIIVRVITTLGDEKSFKPKNGRIIHKYGYNEEDSIDRIQGDPPVQGSCIFTELTLRPTGGKYSQFHIEFTPWLPPEPVVSKFSPYINKLWKEYIQYDKYITDKVGFEDEKMQNEYFLETYQPSFNISLADLQNALTGQDKGIVALKPLEVENVEYHWCAALWHYFKFTENLSEDNLWEQGNKHWNQISRFEERGDLSKLLENKYPLPIFDKSGKDIKEIRWTNFKMYRDEAKANKEYNNDDWVKLFKYHMQVTGDDKNYFSNIKEGLEFEYKKYLVEMATYMHDFDYVDLQLKGMQYKFEDTYEIQQIGGLTKENKKIKSILINNGIFTAWGADDVKGETEIDITGRKKIQISFHNKNLYSAKLFSSNQNFYGGARSKETILYPSNKNNVIKTSIYGGGEYVVWPNTRELTNQTLRNNYIVTGIFIVLAGVQIGTL